MNHRVRIIAKRHQYANNSLQVQTRCHPTNLGMNATQSSSTTSSSMRVSVCNNCINKPIDLRIGASIARTITEAAQRLDTDCAYNGVGINNKFLFELVSMS